MTCVHEPLVITGTDEIQSPDNVLARMRQFANRVSALKMLNVVIRVDTLLCQDAKVARVHILSSGWTGR